MAKDYQQLWMGISNTVDEAKATQTLAEILADKDGRDFVLSLDRENAESCIEILDNVSLGLRLPRSQPHVVRQGIAGHNLKPAERQTFTVALRRLAERHTMLPSRIRMAGDIEVADEPLASSGFADLRSGMYGEHLVAIKTLRVTGRDDYVKIRNVSIDDGHPGHTISIISFQHFYREAAIWSTLSHQNISKLVGVQEDMNNRQFSLVSEWMLNRNIMEYIENHPANRLELVRGVTFSAAPFVEVG